MSTEEAMPKTVAILGLGLMGASLAQALRKFAPAVQVKAYARREASIEAALEKKWIHEGFIDPQKAVENADVSVLCVPILTIPELVRSVISSIKPGAVVTDVGSTKALLAHQLEEWVLEAGAEFVGSHPIAGSEQQGLEASTSDLYQDAVVVICPSPQGETPGLHAVRALWKSVGATIQVMDAETHDQLLARTSHLPHIVASLLTEAVGRKSELKDVGAFCGSGFRDTTRVAEGSATVWHDILKSNGEAIRIELAAFKQRVTELEEMLDRQEFDAIYSKLDQIRKTRKRLIGEDL